MVTLISINSTVNAMHNPIDPPRQRTSLAGHGFQIFRAIVTFLLFPAVHRCLVFEAEYGPDIDLRSQSWDNGTHAGVYEFLQSGEEK